jgi:hypothetical protein
LLIHISPGLDNYDAIYKAYTGFISPVLPHHMACRDSELAAKYAVLRFHESFQIFRLQMIKEKPLQTQGFTGI